MSLLMNEAVVRGLTVVTSSKRKGKKGNQEPAASAQLGFDLAILALEEEQRHMVPTFATVETDDSAPVFEMTSSPADQQPELSLGPVAAADMQEGDAVAEEAVQSPAQEAPMLRRKAAQHVVVDDGRQNFRITDAAALNAGGALLKAEANLAAIEVVRTLEEEGRHATQAEMNSLVKYVGWGGLSKAFADPEPENRHLPGRKPTEADILAKTVQAKLKASLSDTEYEQARASTNTAFFTPVAVIKAIYEGLRHLGFEGGRVLEPSMGIGNFFGAMPEDIADNSTLTGIELDPVTGRIAQELYPKAHIQVCGYEAASLKEGAYDLAIGNVPFGNYSVYDPDFKKYGFLIHDFFFAKTAVKHLREGGLMVFLTSKGTLDKKILKLRRLLMDSMDLVGAIRLPSDTFTEYAGTTVVSDLIIMRKRCKGEAPNGVSWLNTKQITVDKVTYTASYNFPTDYLKRQDVNEYFAEHREMILGTTVVQNGQHGPTFSVKSDDRDLAEAIIASMRKLPAGIYQPAAATAELDSEERDTNVVIPAPGDAREFSFIVAEDKVYRCVQGNLILTDMSPKAADRVRGMIQLRDLGREVLRLQIADCDDATLGWAQRKLTSTYDAFVKKHGYLNSTSNRRAYKGDPDFPFLMALEFWNPEDKIAIKADIFHARTLGKTRKIEAVGTPKEALLVSLNETGRISWSRMAQLTGREAEELQAELRGDLVFLNPTTERWETREQYLSGNVRVKYRAALVAAERHPQYIENVEALHEVQPTDLKPVEISVRIGAPWLPPQDFVDFAVHMFGVDQYRKEPRLKVEYNRALAKWKVDLNDWQLKSDLNNTTTWGTSRALGHDLFEMALNQMVPTVRDEIETADGRTKHPINQSETIAAREKLEQMQDKFVEWLWADEDRAIRLATLYNERFNSHRARIYDGCHLTLPGTATVYNGKPLVLRPHQKDGAWRMVSGVNTLLAHKVGAGKTWTIVAGIMERRRLGLTSKAMIVVPNHLVGQWASEFLQLYPGARILAATPDDFASENRKELFNRIATGDWDAVIVAHTSFAKIPVSEEFVNEFFSDQLYALEDAIKETNDRATTKQLERSKKSLEARMKAMLDAASKDDVMTFQEMQIDLLAVDEAQEFKNDHYISRMPRIAGLPQTASKKAFDMRLKTISVRTNGGVVTFATGTPVSNTMAEVYIMQRYLQPERLEELDLDMFDRWAANFGKTVTALEVSPDGSGFRMNNRFSQFVNVPELLLIFKEVCDVRTAEMLNLPVPKLVGDSAMTIVAERSPVQAEFVAKLVKRAEDIRNGIKKPHEDNMLAVTGDGRKAALDMRLLVSDAADHPDSKVNLMVRQALEIWQDTADVRGAQLIFSDLGTPSDNGRFSVYTHVKVKLLAAGVPAEEIAFIHDANTDLRKEELFRNVRAGNVRFLLGSTAKMGSGTNVQERLVALHHLDAPWRPSDVEQREGRIIRQGNYLFDNNLIAGVRIFRYVTAGSFDAYMWQVLESKARFINQVMRGDATLRKVEDVDAVALNYAEVKAIASGNPLVMRKVEVDTQVRKYDTLRAQYRSTQRMLKYDLANIPTTIRKLREDRADALQDIERRQDTSGENFALVLNGRRFTDRKDAGFALASALDDVHRYSDISVSGEFAGFRLRFARHLSRLVMILTGDGQYSQATDSTTPGGLIRALESMPELLEAVVARCDREIAAKEQRLNDIEDRLAQPFEHEEKLEVLLREQAEITTQLDLDKDDQSTASAEAADVSEAA